jgi:hypothetical protein
MRLWQKTFIYQLFVPVNYAALRKVVGRHFDVDLVAGENTDSEFSEFTRRVSDDFVAIVEQDPEHGIRQNLSDFAAEFDRFFLRHGNPFRR